MLCPTEREVNRRLHDFGLVYRDYVSHSNTMPCFMDEHIVQTTIGTSRAVAIILIPDVSGIDQHVSISTGIAASIGEVIESQDPKVAVDRTTE